MKNTKNMFKLMIYLLNLQPFSQWIEGAVRRCRTK